VNFWLHQLDQALYHLFLKKYLNDKILEDFPVGFLVTLEFFDDAETRVLEELNDQLVHCAHLFNTQNIFLL